MLRPDRAPASSHSGICHYVHGMDRLRKALALVLAGTMIVPSGCGVTHNDHSFKCGEPVGVYQQMASDIEYPEESACTQMNADESLSSPHPWTIDTKGTPQYRDISLEEAIHDALANSRVMRDLGGAVVRSPETTRTTFDPATVE